jgi:hypothetical protein
MNIGDHVLWAVLAGTSGAVGGIWMRHSLRGALPGALLAWTWNYSISYPPLTWSLHANFWVRLPVLLLLGFVSGRLAGRAHKEPIDLPLDLRIGFALFTGFEVRGIVVVFSNMPEFMRFLHWLMAALLRG